MLRITPQSVALWPVPGDVPDLQTIVADQAETIAANAVLIDAYQANLNAVQNPPPGPAATGNGNTTGSSTSLVVSSPVIGIIAQGATVTGTGVPATPPVTILGQISGAPGGVGTYLTSMALMLGAITPLTFTPPGGASTWPIPNDAPTLMLIQQQQTAVLRTQSALLQHYVDLLNTSQTLGPPTGP